MGWAHVHPAVGGHDHRGRARQCRGLLLCWSGVVSMHVGTMGGGYVQYQPDIHDVELVDEGPQMCTRSRCSR